MSTTSTDSTHYAEANPEVGVELIDGDGKPAPSRFLWPKMNRSIIVVDGKKFSGYRFLQDTTRLIEFLLTSCTKLSLSWENTVK
jgi:hypothetical protein